MQPRRRPAAPLAGDWGPATCAQLAEGAAPGETPCQRDPYGVFSVWGLVPTNTATEDPYQQEGVCPAFPPFDAAAIAPADQAALKCAFMDYAAYGEALGAAPLCRQGRLRAPASTCHVRQPQWVCLS